MARKKSEGAPKKPAATPSPAPSSAAKAFVFHTVTPEEEMPDGTLLLEFVIPGRAATKKTHQRVVRRGRHTRILPSEQYERYEKHCKPFIEAVWRNLDKPAMDFGVSVKLRVFLDNWVVGDEVGFAQSLGDLLEVHGVIANDLWIHWADLGTPMIQEPDKANPRVEIEIRRFRHPKEAYRQQQEEAERRKQERQRQRAAKENTPK